MAIEIVSFPIQNGDAPYLFLDYQIKNWQEPPIVAGETSIYGP